MPKRRMPELKTDQQAADFWEGHSLADYVQETEPVADVSFPSHPLKQICLRLAPSQIERVKEIAATKGIGYQTLLRMWITERVRQDG